MKSKSKLKKDLAVLSADLKPKYLIRKGSRFVTRIVESTGIPEGYASVVAWFAERLILAAICVAVASFAGGVLFTLYLSGPIAQSQSYVVFSAKVDRAKEQIIDIASPIFSKLLADYRGEDLKKSEQMVRKDKLKKYLESKGSPFASDDKALDALVSSKNMKLMVAISFVESTFGKHCFYFNCSGIGDSSLRKYKSYAEWITDFDKLLEQRYKNIPPEKFIGLYVQPGSPNWLYGVKQVLKEFEEQGII